MAKIRIVLADDHTLFRQGVKNLLSSEADMEVVGEVSNGGEAIEKSSELRPDVVLMDIGMPGFSSFEATRQIKKNRPNAKCCSSPCTTTRTTWWREWRWAEAATC